jgi:DNA ligase-1
MFPELTRAHDQVRANSVILDSEAVGVDPKTGKFLSFQDTIVRKRKHNIDETSLKVPLRFFVFDVLYKDGKSLLSEPLTKRREILTRLLQSEAAGPLRLTEQIRVDKAEGLVSYHDRQLKKGLEGAVVKKASSAYVPGRRAWNWVKFKEVETARGGLADTLDCVVMGYYQGKGKRAGFGIGAFLVGVRKGEQFLTIAKIGTGLSDAQWKEMKKRADGEKAEKQPKEYVVDKSLVPDVWVSPKIVVEIAADNLTRSPNHSAKLALRFPRLVRFRDDKRVEQATSVREVEGMANKEL